MSESAGNSGGNGAAPGTGTPAAGTGGEVQGPAVQPLGQSPKLQGGISLEDAISKLGKSRQRAARPGRQAAEPGAAPTAAPQAEPQPGQRPAPRANGQAAPNGAAGAAGDPIDGLIRAYREANAPKPSAQPNGAAPQAQPQAQPGAEPATGSVRLTIDGRTHEFSHDQVVNSVRMATDYTNKTKQLADLTRTVNERAEAINRMLPVLMPEIERQIATLDQQLGKQPDWRKLAAEDPAEYQRQDAAWKEAAAERQRLNELMAVQQQESESTRQQRLQQGHADLVKALPGWEDAGTRGRLQSEMIKWGRAQGFPDAELNAIYEPRHVVALFKAMAFDRMMRNVHSDAPLVPHVQGNGARPPQQQQGVPASEAQGRFTAAPNMRNAVSLLNARRRPVH
jgi:hypothetical protein